MEIRKWHYYVVINCALVYCGLAKPFSLNEVIVAESQQKQVAQTTLSPKLEAAASERFSLSKPLRNLSLKPKKFKETGSIISLNKKDSPLKYRKAFQIKSPLKPKRIKHSLRNRHKRRNLSKKREISGNENLKKKYIPLLRNIGMLFDDILGGDTSESLEREHKRKRIRYFLEPTESDDNTCSCSSRSNSKIPTESEEETVAVSEAISAEVATTKTAPKKADTAAPVHIRRFRQNKNIPLLLPRNTFSSRRNNNGLRQRNRAAHHGSIERDISGDNGVGEHNTGDGEDELSAESDEENTDSDTRDDASRFRYRRTRIGGGGSDTRDEAQSDATHESDETSEAKDSMDDIGRNVDEHQGQNNLEIRRNETESAELLPESVRRSRGFVPEDEDVTVPEPLQSQENDKESDIDVSFNIAGNQRIPNGSSAHTQEDKKIGQRNETIITKEYFTQGDRKQGPVVVIIDGYSVTRHKNGENKLSEKSIHIHSK